MNEFNPGDGWVEVDGTWDQTAEALRWDNGTHTRYWIREAPVLSLPAEALAALDGADLIFVSDVLRALGKWKQGRS